jgi:hypothetical protein
MSGWARPQYGAGRGGLIAASPPTGRGAFLRLVAFEQAPLLDDPPGDVGEP